MIGNWEKRRLIFKARALSREELTRLRRIFSARKKPPPLCIVEESKVKDYLLNSVHPDGGTKAKFFLGGGFSLDKPQLLEAALKEHFRQNHSSADRKRDQFGDEKIIIEAPMKVPDGRTPIVVSVWKREGRNPPRLITAYPA